MNQKILRLEKSSLSLLNALTSKKERHCFFNPDDSKMVNCVSASTAAQHLEVVIKRQY
jgi:hypothetical protein